MKARGRGGGRRGTGFAGPLVAPPEGEAAGGCFGGECHFLRCDAASTVASAVMLTMRRTVDDGVRMCTGCAAPSRMPPTVMPPPAAMRNRLYEMFAASTFGITST